MRSLYIAGLALAMASHAHAELVTFEYQGTDYTYLATEQPDEDYYHPFANPWLERTQNHVSGWITIDTSYLPGGSLGNVVYDGQVESPDFCTTGCPNALHSWSFFDGVYTNTESGDSEFFSGGDFRFTTDGDGNFTTWFFRFIGDPDGLNISSTGDARLNLDCTDVSGDQVCATSSGAGTWTRVDETGAAGILLAGLIGGIVARRRRRGL